MKTDRWIELTLRLPYSQQDLLVGPLSYIGFDGFLQVEKTIRIRRGDLNSLPAREYDLVVGNIDAAVLTKSFPRLLRLIRPEGAIILSGFLTSDVSCFLDSLQGQGAIPLEIIDENEWAALALTKARAS